MSLMSDWLLLTSPLLLLAALGLLVMLIEAIWRPASKAGLGALSIAGLIAAMGLAVYAGGARGEAVEAFGGMIRVDGYGVFFQVVVFLAGVLALLMTDDYLDRIGVRVGEYYALVLFGEVGMGLLAVSNDLMMTFVAIEVMSIAMYTLCAIKRGDPRSVESGFKYFILGAFSSGLMLYGIAFVYGALGTTGLPALARALGESASGQVSTLLLVGGVLVLVGFGFKVASVPFHLWAPDVYEGAPTPVTALMASGVKAASFAALGRVVMGAFGESAGEWSGMLWWMSALTMVVGNLGALVQNDLKRMLAYSSIAHAGYLLMALAAVGAGGVGNTSLGSLLFYMLAYTFMNAGAFAVLSLLTRDGHDVTDVRTLAGLGRTNPWLAAGLSLCLLSLAGIPPSMGFIGKFYLFAAAVQAGQVGLAIVGALAAATGVYYYLRPMIWMYMHEGAPVVHTNLRASIALAVSVTATLVFGLSPSPVLDWAIESVRTVVG